MAMDMSQPQPQPQYGTPLPHGTGPEQHHESATPAGQTLYDDYTTWPVLRWVWGCGIQVCAGCQQLAYGG